MAINPNTDFSTGAVLTAAQQNRFPRGIVAIASSTTSDASITVEEIELTSSSFTAVANRYYRATYYEPQLNTASGAGAFMLMRLRLTNLAGTQLNQGIFQVGAPNMTGLIIWTGTLSAGSTTIVGTAASGSGTWAATRAAGSVAYLVVEDMGPA